MNHGVASSDFNRYGLGFAWNYWPDVAVNMGEYIVQQALLLIFEQIGSCQQPETFLAFSIFKLRHAFKKVYHASEAKISPLARKQGNSAALESIRLHRVVPEFFK